MAEAGEPLSEREKEVLDLVATGATNRQIAQELFVSVNTVKVHMRNIFAKLQVESRTEATLVAIRDGLVVVEGSEEAKPQAETAPEPAAEADVESKPALPPLPWYKRLALVAAVVVVAAASWMSWPRAESAAEQPRPKPPGFGNGACAPALPEGNERWHLLVPMSSPRAQLALVATHDRRLVAIGGRTNGGIAGSVEIYDLVENRWTLAASKPTAVADVAAALIDGQIYVPGGETINEQPTDVVEAYDLATDTWDQVAPLPVPLQAYALATFEKKLYLFGGYDGQNYTRSTYVYDPQTDQWSQAANLSPARGYAGAATLGERIFVVGGYDGNRELNLCQMYDPGQDTWTECGSLWVGRGGLGLVAIGDRLFAVGGGWNTYPKFSERYELASDAWYPFETPSIDQWHSLAAAATNTDLYVVGGWCGESLDVLLQYEVLPYAIYVPVTIP